MPINPEGLEYVNMVTANNGGQINTPPTNDAGIMDSPGLEGSFQQLMADNLGRYVQIDFLVGVQTLVRRSGIIYSVGRSFVVLYDETNRNFVMCDVFSAKFVAFFSARPAPGVLPNNPMGIMQVDAQGNLWPQEQMLPPGNVPMPNPNAVSQPMSQPMPTTQGQGWVTLGDWRQLPGQQG